MAEEPKAEQDGRQRGKHYTIGDAFISFCFVCLEVFFFFLVLQLMVLHKRSYLSSRGLFPLHFPHQLQCSILFAHQLQCSILFPHQLQCSILFPHQQQCCILFADIRGGREAVKNSDFAIKRGPPSSNEERSEFLEARRGVTHP